MARILNVSPVYLAGIVEGQRGFTVLDCAIGLCSPITNGISRGAPKLQPINHLLYALLHAKN